jgi:hypothetical protein
VLLDAGATLRATAGELVHREQALQETDASARDAATAVAVATFDRDRTRLVFLLTTGRLPFSR